MGGRGNHQLLRRTGTCTCRINEAQRVSCDPFQANRNLADITRKTKAVSRRIVARCLINYYRPDENSMNSTINYYNKGAIAGMLLDIAIRKRTANQKSLDDVMRLMYQLTQIRKASRISSLQQSQARWLAAICRLVPAVDPIDRGARLHRSP